MELVFAPKLFTKLTAGTPADAADNLEDLAGRMTARQDLLAGKAREHTAAAEDPAVVIKAPLTRRDCAGRQSEPRGVGIF